MIFKLIWLNGKFGSFLSHKVWAAFWDEGVQMSRVWNLLLFVTRSEVKQGRSTRSFVPQCDKYVFHKSVYVEEWRGTKLTLN